MKCYLNIQAQKIFMRPYRSIPPICSWIRRTHEPRRRLLNFLWTTPRNQQSWLWNSLSHYLNGVSPISHPWNEIQSKYNHRLDKAQLLLYPTRMVQKTMRRTRVSLSPRSRVGKTGDDCGSRSSLQNDRSCYLFTTGCWARCCSSARSTVRWLEKSS